MIHNTDVYNTELKVVSEMSRPKSYTVREMATDETVFFRFHSLQRRFPIITHRKIQESTPRYPGGVSKLRVWIIFRSYFGTFVWLARSRRRGLGVFLSTFIIRGCPNKHFEPNFIKIDPQLGKIWTKQANTVLYIPATSSNLYYFVYPIFPSIEFRMWKLVMVIERRGSTERSAPSSV